MDSCDWTNGLRYHTFDTRSDAEFHPVCTLPPTQLALMKLVERERSTEISLAENSCKFRANSERKRVWFPIGQDAA